MPFKEKDKPNKRVFSSSLGALLSKELLRVFRLYLDGDVDSNVYWNCSSEKGKAQDSL